MKIKFNGDEEKVKEAEKLLAICLGDYTPQQQYAASILLHMLLKEEYDTLKEYMKEVTGFKVNNRYGGQAVTWARKVKRAGACEICGSKEKLVAHHLVPWSASIKGRFDVKNGQCLCESCHKMMHNDLLWIEYMSKKRVSKNG